MQRSRRRLQLSAVNPHLMCILCGGYLVDATTIVECLHSFCRSCLINYLQRTSFCPICEVQIHKTKPYLNIKPDKTLQDMVYKLVPGLFHSEMKRRRDFYIKQHPDQIALTTPAQRGVAAEQYFFSPEDSVSLSLEYLDTDEDWESASSRSSESGYDNIECGPPVQKKYLQCPALVTISHLKQFLRMKFDLLPQHKIDIIHRRESLQDDYTLMDVAYIYTWKRSSPMRFFYRIYEVDASSDDTNCCFDVVQETPLEAPVKLSTILEVPDEESSDVTSESQEASGTSYGGRQDEPASGESSQGSKTGDNDATNRDDPGLPPATNTSEKRDTSKTKYPTFTFRLPEPPHNSPSPGPNTPSHPRSPRPSSDQIISNVEDPKHTSQDQGGEVDATENNISSSSHSTPRDPSPTSPGLSTSSRTNVASIDVNTPSTFSKENPTGALSDRGKETCTVLTSKKQDDPSCISVTKENPTSSNVGRCEVASTLPLISKQAIEKSVERDTISIVPVKETVPKIISNVSAAKTNIKPSILPQSGKKPIILCKNGSESTTISNTTLFETETIFPCKLATKRQLQKLLKRWQKLYFQWGRC